MDELTDKVAVVTGAASGIGFALCVGELGGGVINSVCRRKPHA